MKAILYMSEKAQQQAQIESYLRQHVPGIHTQTLSSADELLHYLRRPLNRISVVVLFTASRTALEGLVPLVSLLENIRVILALPDRKRSTLAIGVKFSPSFVTYMDDNLADIAAVLKKIQKI